MNEEEKKVELAALLRDLKEIVIALTERVCALEEQNAAQDREIRLLLECSKRAEAAYRGHQVIIEAMEGYVKALAGDLTDGPPLSTGN